MFLKRCSITGATCQLLPGFSLIGLLCLVIVLSALTLYVVNASKKILLELEIEALSTQTKLVSDMINVYGQGLRRPTSNLLSVFDGECPRHGAPRRGDERNSRMDTGPQRCIL